MGTENIDEPYDLGLCCYCEKPFAEHRTAGEASSIFHCAPFTDDAPIYYARHEALDRVARERMAFAYTAIMRGFDGSCVSARDAGAAFDAWQEDDRTFRARWRYRP